MKHKILLLCSFTTLVLISLLALSCQRTTPVSSEVRDLEMQIEQEPENHSLVEEFIIQAMFEQQQGKAQRSDVQIIESVLSHGDAYLELNPIASVSSDQSTPKRLKTVATLHAMAHFFRASAYNSKGELLKASKQVESGFEHFEILIKHYPQDYYVRAYRAINYANLPAMFEVEPTVQEDIAVIVQLLDDNQSIELLRNDDFLRISITTIFELLEKRKVPNAKPVLMQLKELEG